VNGYKRGKGRDRMDRWDNGPSPLPAFRRSLTAFVFVIVKVRAFPMALA
jgi:hypothetical protein